MLNDIRVKDGVNLDERFSGTMEKQVVAKLGGG